jgi:hypothetical protein
MNFFHPAFFLRSSPETGYFLIVHGINEGNQVQGTLRCLAPVA